jgi:aryl-alcohol dehydrogenase-like predicted oxidoreductase
VKYKQLGSAGIRISEICFGNMTWGGKDSWAGVGAVDQTLADKMLNRCLEAGVNFFDTADIYSQGVAETMLGKALGNKRKDVVIATKVRGRMGKGVNDVGLSRGHILQAVEDSLRRLNTDWIDLYQVHSWDADTPIEETLAALDSLVQSGKVRYIGCSNFTGWQLAKSIMLSKMNGWAGFATLQPLYNIVHRDLEFELIPLCKTEGIGILPWSPLAGGFLTGKYRRGQSRPEGSRRSDPDRAFLKIDEERGYNIVETLDELSTHYNGTVSQSALNWLRAKPEVTSIIIGARTMEQLDDNLACVNWQFNSDEINRLDLVSQIPQPYPYWMQTGWRNS